MKYRILVTGPQGGRVPQALTDTTRTLIRNYARQLGIQRFEVTITVRFTQSSVIDHLGTEVYGLISQLDRRNFLIELALYNNWVVFLAHEMNHVKQLLRGELNLKRHTWLGQTVEPDTAYLDLPWEQESHEAQWCLAKSFYDLPGN